MAELLVLLTMAAVLFQKTSQRALVAFVYAGLCWAHMELDKHMTDVQYFVVAGAFCVITAAVASSGKQTRFTGGLIIVSTCSLLTNLYGWGIYCLGMEPTSYVAVSCVVLTGGLYVLLRKDLANESCTDDGVGIFRILGGYYGNNYSKIYRKEKE